MSANNKLILFLIAEDDPEDRMLITDAIQDANIEYPFEFVEDGEELINYLHRQGKYENLKNSPLPGLIFLDLNMPKINGLEVLSEINKYPRFKRIPIIILTTSQEDDDIHKAYNLGVNSYITKPLSFEKLVDYMKTITKYWIEIAQIP